MSALNNTIPTLTIVKRSNSSHFTCNIFPSSELKLHHIVDLAHTPNAPAYNTRRRCECVETRALCIELVYVPRRTRVAAPSTGLYVTTRFAGDSTRRFLPLTKEIILNGYKRLVVEVSEMFCCLTSRPPFC